MAESWGEDDEVITAVAGDWGAGDEEVDAPKEPGIMDGYIEGVKQVGADYLGRGEAALTMASSMVAEPIAGIAGLVGAALPGDAGQGAAAVEATREMLTYEPTTEEGQQSLETIGSALAPVGEALQATESFLGQGTLDVTGSETLAAVAHTAPTALMEILGLGLLKKPSKAAAQARKVADKDLADAVAELEAPTRTWQDITEDVTKKKPGRLAQDVKPDAQILADAENLGISLNPSHYSTNEAYKMVEQAVKSQPNSQLAAKEAAAIKRLGEAGDELIRDLDADLDRSILDQEVKSKMTGAVTDLEDMADFTYKKIDKAIPRATSINPENARAYISRRVEELGGDLALLAPVERKLYTMLNRTKKSKGKDTGEAIAPTYNGLDTLRRDIAAGYKNQGVFKDDVSGTLDQVYAVLIKDQAAAAKAMGVGEEFAAAQKMVKTRKRIEDRAMVMFGRKMDKSILPKLTQAANKLTKGDVSELTNLMEALPKSLRQKAAATILNDIYTLGQRNKTGIGQGFVTAFDLLEKNAGAKAALFKYLPKGTIDRFEALGRVSRGIFRAKALENTSRTARDILQALDSGTLAERVIGGAAGGAARVAGWKTMGHFGAAAADKMDKAVKGMIKNDRAADELMSSPAFERALNKAMEGKVKEADMMLKRSKTWQKWRNLLGEGTRTQLAAMGPIAWLTQQKSQPEPPPNGQ